MTSRISSKERLLAAINHSNVDYPPFYQKFWQRGCLSNHSDGWKDQFERVKKTTRLGLEDTVGFSIPRAFSTEVKILRRKEMVPGESTAFLFQEYQTPKGTLKQIVRQTEDWPHGDNIPIFNDYVVPRTRSKKYLIETVEDVDAISCLFSTPGTDQRRKFEDHANQVKQFARQNNVLIESGATFTSEWVDGDSIFLADALPWLCGVENALVLARKSPDLIHRLLDIILEWTSGCLEMISQVGGCDVIMHRAWYESFWSPNLYRTFLLPRLKREVDLVHRMGAKYCYIMCSSIMPYLDFFKEMGIDILYGVDPVQGGANLKEIKRAIGSKVCIWGGVNSAVTLTGDKLGVENAVEQAVSALAPGGGFILGAIDQLFEDTRWENFMAMMQTWRKLTSAPNAK